jgi:hypothetical protein
MTTEDLVEKYAIRCALANNGGTWADHYTEAQREHWRAFVRELLADVRTDVKQHGHATPPPHWTAADGWYHPQTAEEWDYRKDPTGHRFERGMARLQFAADRCDPRAPDEMAQVLRLDVLNLIHDWVHKNAVWEHWRKERADKAAAAEAAA